MTQNQAFGVFLVEDETLIRLMISDMLAELGHRVVAEADDIDAAMKLAQSAEFDLAILDVNIKGGFITPVAEAIMARNLPFIFATGYGRSKLPPQFEDRPALQKPFPIESLAQVIDSALAAGPRR